MAACYAFLLLVVPRTVQTVWFLPTLFALRIILFAPFLVDTFADAGAEVGASYHMLQVRRFNTCCLVLLSICGLSSLLVTMEHSSGPRKAFKSNYAARTLTEDLWLGCSSALVHWLTTTP